MFNLQKNFRGNILSNSSSWKKENVCIDQVNTSGKKHIHVNSVKQMISLFCFVPKSRKFCKALHFFSNENREQGKLQVDWKKSNYTRKQNKFFSGFVSNRFWTACSLNIFPFPTISPLIFSSIEENSTERNLTNFEKKITQRQRWTEESQ